MTISPEDFPKCRFCFQSPRACDGGRPCNSCSRSNRTCRDVDQELLDRFPERAQKVLRDNELQKSTTGTGKKRDATVASNDDQNLKKHKTASSTAAHSSQRSFKKKQEAEIKHCYRVINELLSDKYAHCNAHFLYPVDHVALNLPHYRSIVEFPMDLSTMKENMEDGEYKTARNFKKDFMKVVNAARLFNETGSEVYEAANQLQQVFNVVWKETSQSTKKASGKEVYMEEKE